MHISLEGLKSVGLDVDVIIDLSDQPDPDAHQERRYAASVAYGYTTHDQKHYMIFTVRADLSIGEKGAIIHRKFTSGRAFYMQGVEDLKGLDEYAPHFEAYKHDDMPLEDKAYIDALFDEHVPTSLNLPAHRVHYINADMTNPKHRPHAK